jgi:hypothetical protein
MRRRTAAVLGFLSAPLVSALIGAALTPVTRTFDLRAFLGLVPVFYFFAAVVTVLLGIPAFLLLLRFKLVRWWSALGAGFLIGALVALIMRSPNAIQPRDVLVFAPTGAASALSFWLIWKLGREDASR